MSISEQTMNLIREYDSVTLIGTSLPSTDAYAEPERRLWSTVTRQINQHFAGQSNLLISTTWFGPQFDNFPGWQALQLLSEQNRSFDNVFLLASIDPCYLNPTELQQVKNSVNALRIFYLGNFDSAHQFNFFTVQLLENFKNYKDQEILLENVEYLYVNYNRKPKPHRVQFVKRLLEHGLDKLGTITLGKDADNDLYLTIGEQQKDYKGSLIDDFGLPMDYYSLHRLDIWRKTFLYINAATEFDPINDLFCQQDTFKPMLGLRPFVINGVQKTYRWLRCQGFKTFNHYWPHIDIENGNVHDTLIDLIKFLKEQSPDNLLHLYQDMLPDLRFNQQRFYEFAREQNYKINNLFNESLPKIK
jgi:hypothetical protein